MFDGDSSSTFPSSSLCILIRAAPPKADQSGKNSLEADTTIWRKLGISFSTEILKKVMDPSHGEVER